MCTYLKWVGEGGSIDNENRRHGQTKLIQWIVISYLINYSSSSPLSLSLFLPSISLSSTCMSIWSSLCWQSQNSEQLSPALTQLHLYLLHWVETHLQRVICRISSRAIFIPVGSMVGLKGFSPSFLYQPYSHGFSWGVLPMTQFSHMIATWCDSFMFIWRASSVGRRLLSAGGVADFLHHQSS